jgi:hypothetical protein
MNQSKTAVLRGFSAIQCARFWRNKRAGTSQCLLRSTPLSGILNIFKNIRRVWSAPGIAVNTVSCPQLFIRRPSRSITSLQDNMVARLNLKISPSPASIAIASRGRTWLGLIRHQRLFAFSILDATAGRDHFVWDGPELKARTQMGRVTMRC